MMQMPPKELKWSFRSLNLKPSPTLKMAARAQALKKEGKPVINLTVGEPDFPTFPEAAHGGIEAIQMGLTKYTPAAGRPDLRSKLARFLSEELGITVSASEVVVGAGAKFLIYATLQMIINPGDEVLIPVPYWVSYPTMVELCGGHAIYVNSSLNHHYKPTPEDLEKSITSRTKVLILCSPSNPTGAAYTQEELKAIARWLKTHPNLLVISDDIYNRLYFPDPQLAPHLLHVAPELADRTVCIGGASKTFAMTGWRIGWLRACEELASKVGDFCSQTTSNACSISQNAVWRVLDHFQEPLGKELKILKEKKDMVEDGLSQLGFQLIPPSGAFYLFFQVDRLIEKLHKKTLGKVTDSVTLSEYLLEEHYLALVAGSEFGQDGWMRLSYAAAQSELEMFLNRFKTLVS
ncbi:MAG: pyridoxal phosphate-dependent aminotransferase [Bdellovibrionaceae bacterium]|nr:pyridoxal phosphate-dependent aminotransferase [Pseudobdellovibrionaceae bacterium]MDW8189943.1 pyridoxal phosphate-dependent aminotransferase [Pseudobdellovibrionaceae bacterium]